MPAYLPPVTRRRFLASSAAAGAALLAPSWLGAAEDFAPPEADANRWALLADTHIRADRGEPHRDVRPAEKLAAVRAEILALRPLPAGAVIAGDCAFMKGEPGDYAVLAEELRPMREAGVGVHLVLGNHDHRANFFAAFPEAKPEGDPPVADKHVAVVETPRANLFLLDSLKTTDYTPGELGGEQLAWLAAALDARRDKPAVLIAHHYFNRADRDVKVTAGLQDTGALLEVIASRRQVKAYVFGHSHRWEVSSQDGLHLVNVPATAWLFDARQPRGWLDVRLGDGGATVALHALDKTHPKRGEEVDLAWRT